MQWERVFSAVARRAFWLSGARKCELFTWLARLCACELSNSSISHIILLLFCRISQRHNTYERDWWSRMHNFSKIPNSRVCSRLAPCESSATCALRMLLTAAWILTRAKRCGTSHIALSTHTHTHIFHQETAIAAIDLSPLHWHKSRRRCVFVHIGMHQLSIFALYGRWNRCTVQTERGEVDDAICMHAQAFRTRDSRLHSATRLLCDSVGWMMVAKKHLHEIKRDINDMLG